jgi:hypothetical protein
MDSHLVHRAMPYWGEKTRLAIKWRWTSEGWTRFIKSGNKWSVAT